jgi:hypothetical protein
LGGNGKDSSPAVLYASSVMFVGGGGVKARNAK